MAADEVSKSGVWIDSKTGKLVESEPVEGVQLVPKGGVITPDAARQIEYLRKPQPTPTTPVDLSVQEPPVRTVTEPTRKSAPVK